MYSHDFITEVKEVYPRSQTMHRLAEEDKHILGRYLDDACTGLISSKAVLSCLNAGDLQELHDMAAKEERRVHLYTWWDKEVTNANR